MSSRPQRRDRTETNPLFNERKLKLGAFGANLSGACAITAIDGTYEANWPETVTIAKLADEMEFEAMVPVGRWRGLGGKTNWNGRSFETLTWAAGLAATTQHPALFSTTHVSTIHPLAAAKQAMTVDHISGGRFALNIVCGWFEPEFRMFGSRFMDRDERYDYATEWIEIVQRLWSGEEFDYEGRYFQLSNAVCEPHPIQLPRPVVMNAGFSERGRRFAAQFCDVAFTTLYQRTDDATRERINGHRRMAREEYDRDIQIWTGAYVVQRETEEEARDFWHHYVIENGDYDAMENQFKYLEINTDLMLPEDVERFKNELIAGWAGYPLIGTAEQIAEKLALVSGVGVDGVLLNWPQYEDGMRRFQAKVLPLLVEMGLR